MIRRLNALSACAATIAEMESDPQDMKDCGGRSQNRSFKLVFRMSRARSGQNPPAGPVRPISFFPEG